MNHQNHQYFTSHKPEFCIITPVPYLERFATQSNTHLVLAHMVHDNPEYAEFYSSLPDHHYKIMDNSAFELGESFEPERLLDLATKCKAHAIVLPDYPGKHSDLTIESAIKYAPMFQAAGFNTMFVPQSVPGNLSGWIEAYEWAVLDNDSIDIIGMSILGIPNAIPSVHKAYARVVLTHMLDSMSVFDRSKPHHYLGLNSGPFLELPSLIKGGYIKSCDSSGPVWSGINYHRYSTIHDSYMGVAKHMLPPVDFSLKMVNDDRLNIIQNNLDMTLDLFK